MARAKRHYIPGHVWHITHRCHKKEFLLKFDRDRRRWVEWLFESKKRYGIKVLNYMVTSNHIHLLVLDAGAQNVIPDSIKLMAGRTAQEYNQRKNRKGAFWEDRYHATAVECDKHLIQCLVYIDMNMVRAGVVKHPSEWEFSGYNEIQNPKKRYSIIDHSSLMNLLQFSSFDHLKVAQMNWITDALTANNSIRQEKWTQSIAVGSRGFLEAIKERLNSKARGRMIIESGHESHVLHETQAIYETGPGDITRHDHYESPENVYSWA